MGTTLRDRLMAKVSPEPNTGCWLWTGYVLPDGYGQIGVLAKTQRAHRVMYEMFVGPIPEGLQLDHLCRQRSCVNPAHLEPVTGSENMRRSPLAKDPRHPKFKVLAEEQRSRRAQKYCGRGHERTPNNTCVASNGRWSCRICVRITYLARKARKGR